IAQGENCMQIGMSTLLFGPLAFCSSFQKGTRARTSFPSACERSFLLLDINGFSYPLISHDITVPHCQLFAAVILQPGLNGINKKLWDFEARRCQRPRCPPRRRPRRRRSPRFL
uniref:Uncharacterized protein n=1 Tax=Stegastes partitus TaxID=144197 RepID=A0A3B5ATG0_9TELE